MFKLVSMPCPRLPLLLVLATAWCAASVGRAQGGPNEPAYALKVWETDDGLPHNVVNALVQTPDGFLWIGSHAGLVRFDGDQFTAIQSPLLADAKSSSIRAMILENSATLVLATDRSGVVRCSGNSITRHPFMDQVGPHDRIGDLYREADDVFWVLFGNRALWRWDHGKIERFPPPTNVIQSWPFTMARDRQGRVYVGRSPGVEIYQNGRLSLLEGSPTEACALGEARDGQVWLATGHRLLKLVDGTLTSIASSVPWTNRLGPSDLLETADGAVWIGISGQGLWRWTPQKVTLVPTSHSKTNALLEDTEGGLWVATNGGGLDRLQQPRFTVVAGEVNWVGAAATVTEDSIGDIWFANRLGVRRIHDGRIDGADTLTGWPQRAVPICADPAGNIWMASGSHLRIAKVGDSSPPMQVESSESGAVRAIFPARDGSVWVGRQNGAIERYRNGQYEAFGVAQGVPAKQSVQAFGEDANEELWAGTESGLLYELTEGQFKVYSSKDGLPGSSVRAIHGDADGNLWIGTGGAGLIVRHAGHFSAVTVAQGLTDDVISQILEDDFGWLWFGSRRGIFKVARAELLDCAAGKKGSVTPVIYGRSEGLSGVSATGSYQPTAWKSRTGRLWFVTRKGLITTDPAQYQSVRAAPPVYVERVSADGKQIDAKNERLRSSMRRLEFHFTAPEFSAPENVRFRHRLEGFESEWSDPSTERTVTYSSLRPGRYLFSVVAGNSDQAWSTTPASLALVVLPMWWETWWARLAGFLLVAGALVGLARYWTHRRYKERLARLEQTQRLELERKRIARDLHDDLGASLTHVSMMAEELYEEHRDLAEMRAQSAKLAERMRTLARDLDAVVWAVSPKNDTLASLCAYLCQFALEYFRTTSIRCRVETSDAMPAVPLSPEARHHLFLAAKELMNNVVKHAAASQVQLAMRMDGDQFEFTIEDDGRGFCAAEAEASGRNGVRNLRARLVELGGTVEWASPGQGTRVRIRVPLAAGAFAPARESAAVK